MKRKQMWFSLASCKILLCSTEMISAVILVQWNHKQLTLLMSKQSGDSIYSVCISQKREILQPTY